MEFISKSFDSICVCVCGGDAAQVKKLVEWEQKPESHGVPKRWPLYKLDY